MKTASSLLTIKYHSRAIWRSLLALWYGALSDVEDWWHGFVRRNIVNDVPLTPEERQQICDRLTVEAYLRSIESSLPPLPHERHTW